MIVINLILTILSFGVTCTSGIVIATHCAEGILVGADSLESSQKVLIDQLYSQKIYQVNPLVYACFPSFDAESFQIYHRLCVVAKGAELEERLLGVTEVATYAQNLANEMKSSPHLVIVGSDINGGVIEREGEDGISRLYQKIFEVSSSGFMTEQNVATGGTGSDSALLILENSNFDFQDRRVSVSKAKKRVHKILRALRASDSSVNGKMRTFLVPNKMGKGKSVQPLKKI